MSLGCFECREGGAFNTLIIFEPHGKFDIEIPISHYRNFYVCFRCSGGFYGFDEVEKSRFMIVLERDFQGSWNTGTDGDKLKETRFKLISENELERRLPNIFKKLSVG